jgi:hypothetical protein
VGNLPELGNWDLNNSFKLEWNEGHIWNRTINISNTLSFNFKVICKDSFTNQVRWENCVDRNITLNDNTQDYNLNLKWEANEN